MYYISIAVYYIIANKIPGSIGVKIRAYLVKNIFKKCGTGVNIGENVYFGKGKNIILNDYAGIGKGSKLLGDALIEIGEHCTMGPEVMIITGDHGIGESGKKIREQKSIVLPIHIGKETYIGARSTILKGTTIGDNSVIGACSLVNKSVEEGYLYAGVPIKKIRRF